jgi:hypothetical protein
MVVDTVVSPPKPNAMVNSSELAIILLGPVFYIVEKCPAEHGRRREKGKWGEDPIANARSLTHHGRMRLNKNQNATPPR